MRASELPPVSVIIPVKDDPERLARCVEAVVTGEYAGQLEVLVVDNGSSAPPIEVCNRELNVRVLSHPDGGSYAARNFGADHARGTILAFTDADCIPASDWVHNAVERLRSTSSVGALGGPIRVFAQDPDRPTLVELHELVHAFPQQRYVEELHFAATANLVTRASAFRAVGGFDAGMRSGGDNDFGQRLRRAGIELAYAPDVIVAHPARSSMREFYAKRLRVLQGALVAKRMAGVSIRLTPIQFMRSLAPPRHALRVARTDPRLATTRSRARYVVAATAIRYLDAGARWRAARNVTHLHT